MSVNICIIYSDLTKISPKTILIFCRIIPKMTLNLLFLVHDELSTHLLNLKPGFIQGQWFLLRVLPRVWRIFGGLCCAICIVQSFSYPDIIWMDIWSNNYLERTLFQSANTIGGLLDITWLSLRKPPFGMLKSHEISHESSMVLWDSTWTSHGISHEHPMEFPMNILWNFPWTSHGIPHEHPMEFLQFSHGNFPFPTRCPCQKPMVLQVQGRLMELDQRRKAGPRFAAPVPLAHSMNQVGCPWAIRGWAMAPWDPFCGEWMWMGE